MKFTCSAPRILWQLPCLFVIIMGSVFAQEANVKLQFVSFPIASDDSPVELLIGDGETIEVELPTSGISKTFTVPALTSWVLGKSSVDEEGKFKFETYGKAPSIGSGSQLILVLRKGNNNALGFKLIPMTNEQRGFNGGKYFLFNATKAEIAGYIGTKKTGRFALKPMSHTLISPAPSETKRGNKICHAKFFYRMDETTRPFFSSNWRFSENARTMVFIYHAPDTGHIKLHTIRDYVQ